MLHSYTVSTGEPQARGYAGPSTEAGTREMPKCHFSNTRYVGESMASPRAAEGGAAIQLELPGPIVWEMRTASLVLAVSSNEAFE